MEAPPPDCSALAGFEMGYREASASASSCTEDAVDSFTDGYLLGQKLHNVEQALAINNHEFDHLNAQMLARPQHSERYRTRVPTDLT